jgi:hypothetical protein
LINFTLTFSLVTTLEGSVTLGGGSVTTGTGGTSSSNVTFVVGLAVEGVGGAVMPISPACAGSGLTMAVRGVSSVVMADTVEDKPTTVLSTDFSVTLASDVTNVCFVAAVDGAVA